MNIINAENLTKSYTERKLLDKASFYLQEGEKVGVIGINGTGKSTLLKIIAGLEEPDEGQVTCANHIVVRYLPQNPVFDPEMTVLDSVLTQCVLNFVGSGRTERTDADAHAQEQKWSLESDAKSMMTRLGITDFTQKTGELSGGQRKRLALVAALLVPCDVLILDEPTNHLDIASREWVEAAIEEFEGVLLFVSHDRYFIEKFAERIWLLEDGKIRDFPCGYQKYRSILEHEAAAKPAVSAAPKPKKERAKGGTKDADKLVRRLEREIEKQEQVVADFDRKIEAASADYQELTRLLGEKEEAEAALMDLMEQWEQAQA